MSYRNYLETYPYFVAVTLTAQALGVHSWLTEWATALFLGSRVLYVGLYAAGVWLLRSLVWNVAYGGIVLIVVAILRRDVSQTIGAIRGSCPLSLWNRLRGRQRIELLRVGSLGQRTHLSLAYHVHELDTG